MDEVMLQVDKCGNPILEVIVCSVADALEAERGGADRLEIVRDLDRGGLTPDLNLVRDIRRMVSLPLRVMLRENEDDSFPGEEIFDRLCALAFELQQIGVDGLVVGFLRNGSADIATTIELMNAAPRLPATFHHAFDETEDPLSAIAQLKKMHQIDRILSSGGPGTVSERAARLNFYRHLALDEIAILAGGGLDEAALRFLRAHTAIHEFHVGRAARFPTSNNAAVRAHLVERLRGILTDDPSLASEPSASTRSSQ